MNKAQRNEIKLHITNRTVYAIHNLVQNNLNTTKSALQDASRGVQQLIDDERDLAERQEHENDTMRDDEKREVREDE